MVWRWVQWDDIKKQIGFLKEAWGARQKVDAEESAAQEAFYSFDSAENLKKRLELRDIFRDEQLFQSLLPRSESPLTRWTQEGNFRTWVDHWSPASQFIPMDNQRILLSCVSSGALTAALATPLDVIKNQWIYGPQFRGVRAGIKTHEVFRCVRRLHGWKAFYTGFGPTLCTVIPSNLIYFGFYEQMRYQEPPATAAMKARAFTAIATAPMEYVRTRLQANVGEFTTRELLRAIFQLEGLLVFSKGVVITVLRDAPFSALYWTMNEKAKRYLTQADPKSCLEEKHQTLRTYLLYPLATSTLSATIATVLTHPLDVIKTTIQGVDIMFKRRGVYYRRYNGILSISSEIYHSQGWRGFFVGLTPRLLTIVPSSVAVLLSYTFLKDAFKPRLFVTSVYSNQPTFG